MVLIIFIYTDSVEEDQMTLALLSAADKYNISVLFNKCELRLCSSISIENAADYFLMAYLHEASILKQIAISFIIDYFDEIKDTQGMSLISKSHPKALLEILQFSAKR
jgi:speckle-type POZ protein